MQAVIFSDLATARIFLQMRWPDGAVTVRNAVEHLSCFSPNIADFNATTSMIAASSPFKTER